MIAKLQALLASGLAALKALPATLLAAAKPQTTAEWIRLVAAVLVGAKLSGLIMLPIHIATDLVKLALKLL